MIDISIILSDYNVDDCPWDPETDRMMISGDVVRDLLYQCYGKDNGEIKEFLKQKCHKKFR